MSVIVYANHARWHIRATVAFTLSLMLLLVLSSMTYASAGGYMVGGSHSSAGDRTYHNAPSGSVRFKLTAY